MSRIYGDIISIDDNRISVLRKTKNDEYEKYSIKKKILSEYQNNGYTVYKELKTRYKVRKKKNIDIFFEDNIWVLLSQMGFDELNYDRNFKISISNSELVNPKQIDVFVKDENTVIIVECKSAINKKSLSLRKDINEINGIRETIINNIRDHYGGNKLKVGWIIATYNIDINQSDKELMKGSKIFHLNESLIKYYNELVKQIGKATKYFFLANVFYNQKIPNLDITIPAIKGRLGNNTFYSFAIEPSKLLPIAYVSHRLNSDNSHDTLSYQRMLSKSRLKSIREYIDKDNGIIPNSIIINFHKSKGISRLDFSPIENSLNTSNTKIGFLRLPNVFKSAWVIDGQHRLYSFVDSEKKNILTVPVIAFDGLDSVEQARLFKDINSKQVKVPRNLLDDLYSDLFWDSDDEGEKLHSLISRIVIELGNETSSPFYEKICSSTESNTIEKPLTIATLTKMISDSNLLGKVERSSNTLIPGPLYSVNHDKMLNSKNRAKSIIMSYYRIFSTKVAHNWDLGKMDNGYLCTNNGVVALFILFEELIKYIKKNSPQELIYVKDRDIIRNIEPLIEPLITYFNEIPYQTFMQFRKQQGKAGQRNCAYDMMGIIHDKIKDFCPLGLEQYIKNNDPKYSLEAHELIRTFQLMIDEHIIKTLQDNAGMDWWHASIPEKIRIAASSLSETDPEHLPKEKCLVLINYKEIIIANWSLFSEVYGFKELGEGKNKQLSWFDRYNRIRNKDSHPVKGFFTQDDIDFLKECHKKIENKIGK